MNGFKFQCICLMMFPLIWVGCGDVSATQHQFKYMPESFVTLTDHGKRLVIECTFPARKTLSPSSNKNADRKTALILAEKALADYFDLQPNEILQHKGMESDKPVYQDGRVKIRFQIDRSNCRKTIKPNQTESRKE